MKVAVFSTFVRWTPHFETELEIIQRHLDAGDTVHHYICNGELEICDQIIDHRFFEKKNPLINPIKICKQCIAKRKRGSSLLSNTVQEFSVYRFDESLEGVDLKFTFSSLDELRDYSIDGYDIGESIASSLISHTRNPYLNPYDYSELIRRLFISCYKTYSSTLTTLKREIYDVAYVFNGRFSVTRSILRACQLTGTECLIHERGSSIHSYELFRNVTPHDLTYRLNEILRYWEMEPNQDKKIAIGSSFFEERAKGIQQSWYPFVNDQEKGLLPPDWDSSKNNIVIFNSSEDEYAAIGKEWKNPIYDDQLIALQQILSESLIVNNVKLRLYLRVHPNLKDVDNDYMRGIYALDSNKINIIKPESPVSTYDLIKACNNVLTFASTVGIEAVYWGKPSILAGISLCRDLDATYNPASHKELIEMLVSDLPPKDKSKAIIFGYYMKTFGVLFRYFQAEGVASGKFKGVDLDKNNTPTRFTKIRSILRHIIR